MVARLHTAEPKEYHSAPSRPCSIYQTLPLAQGARRCAASRGSQESAPSQLLVARPVVRPSCKRPQTFADRPDRPTRHFLAEECAMRRRAVTCGGSLLWAVTCAHQPRRPAIHSRRRGHAVRARHRRINGQLARSGQELQLLLKSCSALLPPAPQPESLLPERHASGELQVR